MTAADHAAAIRAAMHGPDPFVGEAALDALLAELEAAREREAKLVRLGTELANAAERLEENPLANCLPRFRDPVVWTVGKWRDYLAAGEPTA